MVEVAVDTKRAATTKYAMLEKLKSYLKIPEVTVTIDLGLLAIITSAGLWLINRVIAPKNQSGK